MPSWVKAFSEDTTYRCEDWQLAVAEGETRLGYWHWVDWMRRGEED